jgi:hypothetical protein
MSLPYVCPICRHYGLNKEGFNYYPYQCPVCFRHYKKIHRLVDNNYDKENIIFIEELTHKEYEVEIYVNPSEED